MVDPDFIECLENAEVDQGLTLRPFRMVVQLVNRPDLDFRGFSGTVATGTVRPGDEILVAVSGRAARVLRIVTADGDLEIAQAGDSVTLTLSEEGGHLARRHSRSAQGSTPGGRPICRPPCLDG